MAAKRAGKSRTTALLPARRLTRCRPPMARGGAVLYCRGPGAAGPGPGEQRRALPQSLQGGCPRAGGGAGAPELQPSPSGCCWCRGRRWLRSALGVASRERCDSAAVTRLLTASVLVAHSSVRTDGAALSSNTEMAGRMASARSTRAVSFGWRSAMSLEKLEKSPREILHPEIQKLYSRHPGKASCHPHHHEQPLTLESQAVLEEMLDRLSVVLSSSFKNHLLCGKSILPCERTDCTC
ncbi:uncharacterized protein GJ701_006297 [Geothlypis trichas]